MSMRVVVAKRFMIVAAVPSPNVWESKCKYQWYTRCKEFGKVSNITIRVRLFT